MLILWIAVSFTFLHQANCDIYLHNPRGSNNRLNEAGRERDTATRLFDSQNNNRGGYNVGSLFYYAGSQLPIEWTNQHSCGDVNSHCDIVLQYMCDSRVRDGARTQRIPAAGSQCADGDCDSDPEFGMHEPTLHRVACERRRRNRRLFVADQRLRGDSAAYTRQNPDGTRYGYECPEERDYYPYWGHSPWRDIAVLTNDVGRCGMYRSTSQNVRPRWECRLPLRLLLQNPGQQLPDSEEECKRLVVANQSAVWQRQEAWGLPPPVCRQAEITRDNHLGNTRRGEAMMFNWTLPTEAAGGRCVLRVRYNISTGDYERWSTANGDSPTPASGLADASEAKKRGFRFAGNPQVQLFPQAPGFKLQLQINTQQFGRVFQDRSHVFHVRHRPQQLPENATVYNVNVRGKRGNIVQVYPGVEYDFTPWRLHAAAGDWLHAQWTGSNGNNRNNDGQGLAGTDRSNLLPLVNKDLRANLATLLNGSGVADGGWSASSADAVTMATLSPRPQLGGDLQWLDDAGTYFDLGLRRLATLGNWSFASSRNNDFSNRSHKWRLVVAAARRQTLAVDAQGGDFVLFAGAVRIRVPDGAFAQATFLEVEVSSEAWGNLQAPSGDTWFTDFLRIGADSEAKFAKGLRVTMTTRADAEVGHDVQVYSFREPDASAEAAGVTGSQPPVSVASQTMTFVAAGPGLFRARGFASPPPPVAAIVVSLVAALLLVGIVAGVVAQHRRQPQFFAERCRFLRRSAGGKV